MDINIKYYKWNKKDYKILNRSSKKIDMEKIQFFQPYFALYFNIHNTKYANKCIDLDNNIIIKEIIDQKLVDDNTSNSFVNVSLYHRQQKHLFTENIFCKCIPLLDPYHYIMNNYNRNIKNNLLPSNYNYNTNYKINNINNNAYIDTFFSYICSYLTQKDISVASKLGKIFFKKINLPTGIILIISKSYLVHNFLIESIEK